MTFEDDLGTLLRQAGDAHTLPTPAGAATVTARYKRRHRRRNGIGGVAAALVLAAASYGIFQSTAVDDSSMVATVPDRAVVVEEGSSGDVSLPQPSPTVDASAEPIPATEEMVSSIGSIATVDGRYVGFSSTGAVPGSTESPGIVGLESADGENWNEFDLGNLPDSLVYVHQIHEGADGYLLVAADDMFTTFGPSALFLSDDMTNWTEVDVPLAEPAEGMVSVVTVREATSGPSGFVAVVDTYEEVDPARLGLTAGQMCGLAGMKETPESEQATYTVFPCGPDQAVEDITVEVASDFQPRNFVDRPGGRVLFIGDGSAPTFVESPTGISRITTGESGYVAMTTGELGENSISRSVDGRTWTEATGSLEGSASPPFTGGLVAIDGRLLAMQPKHEGVVVAASDDDGASWSDLDLSEIKELEGTMAQSMAVGSSGVAITMVEQSSLDFVEPGSIKFAFEDDGYVFRTAEEDPAVFEVVDSDGKLVRSVPLDSIFDESSEIEGMERDSAGGISVLDEDGERLVRFHINQILQNFEVTGENEFATGVAVLEKDGYRLEITPTGMAMNFSLFEGDEMLNSWTLDETLDSQPGLEFNDAEDAVFSDVETGEQLLVVTEAEGSAAIEQAAVAGDLQFNGAPSGTTYVIASRDGVNWDVAGQFDGFGGSMTIGDGEIVLATYGAAGANMLVLPMPES